MIRNDYLLSLIEQAAAVLASVVQRKKEGVYDRAIEEIRQACERLTGLSFDVVEVLPPDELVSLLSRGGSFDPARAIVLADLLREYAEICELQANGPGAYHRYLNALCLYLESLPQLHRTARPAYAEKCWKIVEALADYDLPAGVCIRLARFFEDEGAFARAEDSLFEAVDAGWPDAIKEGAAFYRRLLALPDERLAAGRLPRAEVEEGLAALRARADLKPD